MDENVREADTVCGPFQHDVSAGPRTGQERASSSPVERLAWRPNNSQEETNPQKDGHLYVIFLYVFFFFFFFLSIYLYAPPRRMRTGSSSTLLNIFGRLNKRKKKEEEEEIVGISLDGETTSHGAMGNWQWSVHLRVPLIFQSAALSPLGGEDGWKRPCAGGGVLWIMH